jgi:anti-anti-sigma factor
VLAGLPRSPGLGDAGLSAQVLDGLVIGRLVVSVGVAVSMPSGWRRSDRCVLRRDGDSLRLRGDIDPDSAAMVTERIVAAVRSGVWQLDLSAVRFCSADGVRALLAGRDAARAAGRDLYLACSPQVLRVLRICGLSEHHGLVVRAADGSGGRDWGPQ